MTRTPSENHDFKQWYRFYRREYGWTPRKAFYSARCRIIGERIDRELAEFIPFARRVVLTKRHNRLGARLSALRLERGVA